MSAVQVFWKHCGKREIACNKQFLLFPQCFLSFPITFCHYHKIWIHHLQSLCVWKSLKFVVVERVNFRTFPWKARKHCRKGEKKWLPKLSPFQKVVTYIQSHQNSHCVVQGVCNNRSYISCAFTPFAPPVWLSGERVRLMTWGLWVRSLVEATFLSSLFSPLTSAEASEKSS